MALMILVNNPGSWGHIYSPLEHAHWHGLTPTDLVFPFFLFAVGNALAFVLPRLQQAGDAHFWQKVVKRTLLIFLIGLFLNWWPFARWQNNELVATGWTWMNAEGKLFGVRIFGVLQRIALCYFFASVLAYYLKPRGAFLAGFIMLLFYWMLCVVGNPADPYSLTGWFGTDIDKAILGELHMYKGEGVAFDPEGLMSTVPAIVQVIFGYLVGDYIIKNGKAREGVDTVDGGQMTVDSGKNTDDGRQVTVGSGKNRDDSGQMTVDSGNITEGGGQMTVDSGKNTGDGGQMTGDSGNITDDGGQMTVDSKRVESSRPPTEPQNHLYYLLTGLFIIAMAFLLGGYAWGLSFPVNKKIWTSSYVVVTTGMAIAILATLIYFLEVKKVRSWWTRFFDVFGKNALFVFALSAFLPKGLRLIRIPNGVNDKGIAQYVSPWNWLYEKVYKFVPGAPEIGSLLFALTVILFMWAICYWMDKKRIYIKV